MNGPDFDTAFESLTGFAPQPWQQRLFHEHFDRASLPAGIDIPTGLGKTAVIALWLVAIHGGSPLPRRLVYVVDRRAVVDQATEFVNNLRARLPAGASLPVSTLRGQYADNREWLDDPSKPAIIVGTVDMIGSRLLFEGYGVSRKMRPYHAGLLGTDTLIVLDEAHLVPPFEHLLARITSGADEFGAPVPADAIHIPRLHLLSLSATGRSRDGQVFCLNNSDLGEAGALTQRRLMAAKKLQIVDTDQKTLPDELALAAWRLAEQALRGSRYLIYVNSRDHAEKAIAVLRDLAINRARIDKAFPEPAFELFIGARRGHEREAAAKWLTQLGFLGDSVPADDRLRFLVATSAGEVGVDLDADHMVCDLVAWDRMIQRLGRVNRRGNGDARIVVLDPGPTLPKSVSDAEKIEFERLHRQVRELLIALPEVDGWHDVSPGALRRLKLDTKPALQAAMREAVTREPLRPGLTRAVLDSWAMTNLKEHTGRPEVGPWLRGWVDEEPRTVVIWRRYMPVQEQADGNLPEIVHARDVEAYFEAAPPHISEQLETETYRIAQWLIVRARKNLDTRKKGDEERTRMVPDCLRPLQIAVIILTGAGDLQRAFTLKDLYEIDKKRLSRELAGRLLVVHAGFGGCGRNGTLDAKHDVPPKWLGDAESVCLEDAAEAATRAIRWCVVRVEGDEPETVQTSWRKRFEFPLSRNVEGEIATRLIVYKWKQDAANEEDRAIGREQSLVDHQCQAAMRARQIGEQLGLQETYVRLLVIAARLHDEGKRAERWQRAFNAPPTIGDAGPYAKTNGPVNIHRLDGYRHEFGSLLYVEDDAEIQALATNDQDLVLHLIAAHHGNARPTISTRGCDQAPPSLLTVRAREVAHRFARLQRRWGPWGLAWWEALLRAADQQASKDNEPRTSKEQGEQD